MPESYKLKKIYIWVPSEYQQVEYIEGNGTQRIDLLTTPTSNTKVQFKFMPKGWTGWTALGYYTGNDNTDWRFFTSYGSTSAIYTDHPGRPVFDFNSSRLEGPDNTFALNTVYELEMGNYYLKYLDGANILTGNQISGFTGTTTIKLDYSYSVSTQASNRWYYVKIWDGDVLVKNFVPCYRVSDGAAGLYDLVEGKFYGNSGTGTFTKGADVTSEIMVEKQVWPPIVPPAAYEISYDLKGGSLNGWIEAGGDSIATNSSYGFDSNGMYITGSGTDKYFALFAELPDFTNAKKVTVSFTGYFISNSWSNNKRVGLSSGNAWEGNNNTFLTLDLAYNSSSPSTYNGAGLCLRAPGSEQRLPSREYVGYATGDVTATFELDLSTGDLTGTVTGANTKNYSATLSSSQLETAKALKYAVFEKEEGYPVRSERLKEVYLKIEY